jgi:hypothetical protein
MELPNVHWGQLTAIKKRVNPLLISAHLGIFIKDDNRVIERNRDDSNDISF